MHTVPFPNTAPARPNFSRKESDDRYQPVVAHLAPRWRVIVCRDGIQWILQFAKKSGHGLAWRGRSYLRTRDGLIASCRRLLPEIDPSALATLHSLPERI